MLTEQASDRSKENGKGKTAILQSTVQSVIVIYSNNIGYLSMIYKINFI